MLNEIDLNMTKKEYNDFLQSLVTIGKKYNHTIYELHKRVFLTFESKFCELKYNHENNFNCISKHDVMESSSLCNNIKYNTIFPFTIWDAKTSTRFILIHVRGKLKLFSNDANNGLHGDYSRYKQVKCDNVRLFVE